MTHWLVKTEPGAYSWDDLVRDGTTPWTGVTNPQAQANLRAMSRGDRVVVYHSGEKRAMGIAEVARTAYPDPTGNGHTACVDLRALEPLASPVTLEALKEEPAFEGSALLRQGRLSVVPLSPAEWRGLETVATVIARTGGPDPRRRR